jgi:VWFA-related protein
MISTGVAAILLVAAFGARPQEPRAKPASSQPVFRSGVELLAIDVSVVDKDGRPVPGLSAADFVVTVGGQRRQVVRAEFIDFTQSAVAPAEAPEVSSNQTEAGAPEPRTVLILLDDAAFNPAEGKAVFMRLADQVEGMFPRDPVGLATISGRAKAVDFTTDRRPVVQALRTFTGSRLSLSAMTAVRLGVQEAIEIDQGRNSAVLDDAVSRECAGLAAGRRPETPDLRGQLEVCRDQVMQEARTIAAEAERQSEETIQGLSRMFRALGSLPGTKYVLFVSPGIPLGRSQERAIALARDAAAAGVRLHAFYVERNAVDASIDRISPRSFGDSGMMADGLQLAVDAAGGTMHRLVGDAAPAIERVRREMSGVYRLGIQIEGADADGKAHNIEVKVPRPGLSTRSYRQIVAPTRSSGLSPADRLKRALQSPLVEREIGVRLATFVFRDEEGSGRVMASAEVDAEAAGLKAAFVVRNARGTAETAAELTADAIVAEKDAPPLLLFVAPVRAGDHTIKLALVDADGRVGSAVRSINVRAGAPTSLALGDVLVLPEGQTVARARPSARIPQGSRQASVYFELYGAAGAPTKTKVRLEVADSPEGAALLASEATVPLKPKGKMSRAGGQMKFSPAALPPGRYVARVRVVGEEAAVLRSFTVVAGASAALLADESRALVPFFSLPQFLGQPLLKALAARVGATGVENPAVRNVALALEDGSWRELSTATGDRVVDSTLRGLQALASGQAADAERSFRDALDADPEFTIALALVGGAWASVGRDSEASRSWRTSLATGIDAPFLYPFVADALLRTGDVKGTGEFIAELQESGADISVVERQRALARAIAGDRRETVATLTRWVDEHPDDLDAAFVLVLALYELKTIDKDASAAPQFEARAHEYVERGGPRRALVSRWLR